MKTKYLESDFIEAKHETPNPHHKVMIVMHGLGDSKESYKLFTQEINVTGLAYLLVNAPRPYPIGSSWYDLPPANPIEGVKESAEIIGKIIDELKEAGYKNDDIFLCGFSQGGCIALHSLVHYNQKLAGVIALSPRVFFDDLPKDISDECKKTPIFMAHGEFDPVIDFKETSTGHGNIKQLGFDTSFFAYEMEHEIDVMEIIDLRSWLNEYL